FETGTKAGLVNIGWGVGPGGIQISGTRGRIEVRYRDGATTPWAPLDRVLVTTDAGTRVELAGDPGDGARGLAQSIFRSFEPQVAAFASVVLAARAPIATGADGRRILEATLGAYASAARGAVVEVPLNPAGALFGDGVLSLQPVRSA